VLNGSVIKRNSAGQSGGGIGLFSHLGITGITRIIDGSTVSDNVAGNRGGGVSSDGGSLLIQNRSTISGNTAGNDGGGLAHLGDDCVEILDSLISSNAAGGFGGGVYIGGWDCSRVDGSAVVGNTFSGLYSRGHVEVTNSLVAFNGVGFKGVGIEFQGASSNVVSASSNCIGGNPVGVLDAIGGRNVRSNWWNAESGPKNAGDAGNTASGTGDGYFTAGASNFEPFLISRPPACSLPLGPGVVSIDLEKLTNNRDADSPWLAARVSAGSTVTWKYVLTNTGILTLSRIRVSDDHGVTVVCPAEVLDAGESMTCTGTGIAVRGEYANIGKVTADYTDLTDSISTVSDADPSHYIGLRDTARRPALDSKRQSAEEDRR